MELNQEMVDYLIRQLDNHEKAEDELMFALTYASKETLIKLFSEMQRHSRYIRHAIKEAHDCEHCKETGLIVTL